MVANVTEEVSNGIDDEETEGQALGLSHDDLSCLQPFIQILPIDNVPFPVNVIWTSLGWAATAMFLVAVIFFTGVN